MPTRKLSSPAERLGFQAVGAWRRLRGTAVAPERVEILKGGRRNSTGGVCRLVGVGSAGSAVIAKQQRAVKAVMERTIYEEVLRPLPLPTLRYYGYIAESDSDLGWSFLEDTGGKEYSPLSPEHRSLAGEWLGRLHTWSARAAIPPLRDRGPDHHRSRLRAAADAMDGSLANPVLTSSDVAVLKAVITQCRVLEEGWSQVEAQCARMPRTLVHGDFVGKNLRLRATEAVAMLLPFDWGNAGWGFPAVDLAQTPLPSAEFSAEPDLAAYWDVVRHDWPELELRSIEQWATLGTMFRCLTAICWSAASLANPRGEQAMSQIAYYQAAMASAMQAVGGRIGEPR